MNEGTVPATQALARWIADINLEDLPQAVKDQAQFCLVDFLGCALLGSTRVQSYQLLEVVESLQGSPQSTLIGNGYRTNMAYAALFNGVLGSASLLFEDTAAESFAHPGVNVVPAALATAEATNASKGALLLAITIGYEVSMRVGAATGWMTFKRGWHPRGGFNVFGAASAAGKLLGLETHDQYCAALGLAGTQASGLVEASSPYDGWLLLSGSGAHDGVMAALLAKHGWSAGCTVIEGPRGYLSAVAASPRPERVLQGLGEVFEILSITRKRFASSSLTHSAIDLIMELRDEYALNVDMVKSINVKTIDIHYLLDKRWPESRLEGPHSLAYLMAAAFLDSEISDRQFDEKKLNDPRVRKLFECIQITADEALTAQLPGNLPARVIIALHDGRILRGSRDYPRGDPRDPLSLDELRTKFQQLAGSRLSQPRLDKLWDWCLTASDEASVSDLVQFYC